MEGRTTAQNPRSRAVQRGSSHCEFREEMAVSAATITHRLPTQPKDDYGFGRSSRSVDSRGNSVAQLEGWLDKQGARKGPSPLPAHTLPAPPPANPKPKPGHLVKNWKRRFFVKETRTIKKNNFSGVEILQDVLVYYANESRSDRRGMVVLSGSTVIAASDKPCIFAIEEPPAAKGSNSMGQVYGASSGLLCVPVRMA